MPSKKEFQKDKFLSSIFKKNCYAINRLRRKNFIFKKNSFYQIRVKNINKNLKDLFQKKKFKLIEKNLTFLGKYKKKDSLNIKIEDVQRKERQLKFSKELFIFQNSRFFRDKKIPKRLAIDFKKKWLNNFFTGKRGNKLYVIKKGNKVIGYLLLLIRKNIASIDLINIKKNFRKKGLAKEMINKFFIDNPKIKFLKAGTQSKNKNAINFYKSLGMKLIQRKSIYHLHT